jgi:hypothetical protein
MFYIMIGPQRSFFTLLIGSLAGALFVFSQRLTSRLLVFVAGWWCGALQDGATNPDYRPFGAVKPLDCFRASNRVAGRGYRAVSSVCFSCRARPVRESRCLIVSVSRF